MQINSNIPALQAWMSVNNTNNQMQTTIQRLSTGYKINSAADNAAGYAIVEKMTGQVNGLNTAIQNSQNAVSLIQTASGALNQTQSILQRMRELSVQASNDTNTTSDRQQMQKEINQLTSEIDQIRNTTQFNTQTLLNGTLNSQSTSGTATVVNPSNTIQSASVNTGTIGSNSTLTINTMISGSGSQANYVQVVYNGQLLSGSGTNNATISGNTLTVDLNGTKVDVTLANLASGGATVGNSTSSSLQQVDSGALRLDESNAQNTSLQFQVGANQSQTISLGINDMGSQALGLESTSAPTQLDSNAATNTKLGNGLYATVDVTTQVGAEAATSMIDNAIQVVSTEASKLGAVQNRLTHISSNLQTSSTNLTSAESTLKNADMAKEMMNYQKEQILLQSSMAMLSHANSNPQQVLKLFQ